MLATQESPATDELSEIAANDTKPTAVILYSTTEATIATMGEKYMKLKVNGVNDKAGLKRVHDARIEARDARVAIDKTRKKMGEDSRKYIEAVNARANVLIGLIEPIEDYLTKQENAVKDEIARIEAARIEAIRVQRVSRFTEAGGEQASAQFVMQYSEDEFNSLIAQTEQASLARLERERVAAEQAEALRVERERLDAERDELLRVQQAENARLVAERAAIEKERVAREAEAAMTRQIEEAERAAERAELDKQRAEIEAAAERLRVAEENRVAAEQAEIARQQAAIDAEKLRVANEEAARLLAIENERIAREAAETARAEIEARLRLEADAERTRIANEAAEAARNEAMRPDREKLLAVADAVRAIVVPGVSSESASMRLAVSTILENAAAMIASAVNEAA